MTIAFNQVPADQRASLFLAEFNAGAPPYSGTSRQVITGHKVTGGTAVVGVLVPVGSTDPNAIGGVGSMLAAQNAYARRHDPFGEIYALAGSFTENKNAKLLDLVGKTVEAKGEVTEANGVKTLNAKAIIAVK